MSNLKRICLCFSLFISPLIASAQVTTDYKEIEMNVCYVKSCSNEQQLDIYYPTSSKNFPTLIFIHGGSLTEWDKKDEPYATIANNFVSQGIACVMINYRLAPKNKWPAMPEDVAQAFSWVKKNIKSKGGDPTKIFVSGHSSGALLAALIATDAKYLKKNGYRLTDIAGCISMGTMLNPSYDADGIAKDN